MGAVKEWELSDRGLISVMHLVLKASLALATPEYKLALRSLVLQMHEEENQTRSEHGVLVATGHLNHVLERLGLDEASLGMARSLKGET